MSNATPTPQTEALEERAMELAEKLDPSAGDTEAEKELAEAMVDLRGSILNEDGRPDWLGQTHEFRVRAQLVHSVVSADAQGLSRLKARLRQHYLRIVKDRMDSADLDTTLHRIENESLPMGGNFFDDLGVFIEERGRKSATSDEAHVLALLAGKLLSLIDPDSVSRGGANTLNMTLEQVVENQSERIRDAILS